MTFLSVPFSFNSILFPLTSRYYIPELIEYEIENIGGGFDIDEGWNIPKVLKFLNDTTEHPFMYLQVFMKGDWRYDLS